MDNEYKNCIDICLKYMRIESQEKEGKIKNIRAYVPLESCLIKLNTIDYPYISKLYKSMFIETFQFNLPRFCLMETKLPTLYLSNHMAVIANEIVPKEFFSNTGRPIVFSHSVFPLDIEIGTKGSVQFLQSLLNCSDPKVFRTSIVQEYLKCKWQRIKPAIYLTGFLYALYLLLLGMHIVFFLTSKVFLSFLIFVHILLVCFEIVQVATDFTEY